MRMQKRISLSPESTRCSTCMLNSLCLPLGINSNDIVKFDEVVSERIRIPKGAALFHQGDPATAIYGIRSGSIKTQLEDAVGQVQVTGFLLPGERSEEHTSELRHVKISYAVFCLKKKRDNDQV